MKIRIYLSGDGETYVKTRKKGNSKTTKKSSKGRKKKNKN